MVGIRLLDHKSLINDLTPLQHPPLEPLFTFKCNFKNSCLELSPKLAVCEQLILFWSEIYLRMVDK